MIEIYLKKITNNLIFFLKKITNNLIFFANFFSKKVIIMGNTSCRYVMKNELRKESNLYKNSQLLYFISTFLIWYLYIQHRYEGINKWYIMPITAYFTVYLILGTLIYFCTELTMDNYKLNNKIYKCLQWQQNNRTCTKRLGKCIVNVDDVQDWNSENPTVINEQYQQSINTNNILNQTDNYESNHIENIPIKSAYRGEDIKPGNYYL